MKIEDAVIESSGFIDEDIIECLRCLYRTVEGTCPLYRDFGISIECVDKPMPVAKNLYTLDVIEKTEKFEPRVQVTDITFEATEDTLIPHIKIAMNYEYEEEAAEDEEDGDE